MSAPEIGQTYRLITTGERFRYIGSCPDRCHHFLQSLDAPTPNRVFATTSDDFAARFELASLLGVAQAVGLLLDAVRAPGEQPLVEFTAGPVGPGPLWSDANLAKVFGLDSPGSATGGAA